MLRTFLNMGNDVFTSQTSRNRDYECSEMGQSNLNSYGSSPPPSLNTPSHSSTYGELISSASKSLTRACGSLADTLDEDTVIATRHNHNDLSSSPYRNSHSNNLKTSSNPLRMDPCCGPESSSELIVDNPPYSPRPRGNGFADPGDDDSLQTNPMSALFARALISEVTDNPRTMHPAAMAEREKKLLKAQARAKTEGERAVGRVGIMPGFLKEDNSKRKIEKQSNQQLELDEALATQEFPGQHRITLGLSLSRRYASVGHADTITRQNTFDFNELQDRQYKYISSTDPSGWRAGGGEGGNRCSESHVQGDDHQTTGAGMPPSVNSSFSDEDDLNVINVSSYHQSHHGHSHLTKVASPDIVHIPIIHIDCNSSTQVDVVISALARGEIFIPHMAVLPESLGFNGVSPPDLIVKFHCERNDDVPPDEWPNWCLEFMHNQLYEYFVPMRVGIVRWMPRPFHITLARKVRWKTVKHMNRYFARSERVLQMWREEGPQYLTPYPGHLDGGATPDEVAHPHGLYLLRNGRPTNYFPPNFEPPYTTKMTRSLLSNVIGKSWDKKRRDWTSEPVPKFVTPVMLISSMFGCSDVGQSGFVAVEATDIVEAGHAMKTESVLYSSVSSPHRGKEKGRRSTRSKYRDVNQPSPETVITLEESEQTSTHHITESSSNPIAAMSAELPFDIESKTHTPERRRRSKSQQKLSINTPGRRAIDAHIVPGKSIRDMNPNRRRSRVRPKATTNSERDNLSECRNLSLLKGEQLKPNILPLPSLNTHVLDTKSLHNTLGINNDKLVDGMISHGNYHHGEGNSLLVNSFEINANTSSVGESHTTVPMTNGSSTRFIEQERGRRRLRELERERERKKMDELEAMIRVKKKGMIDDVTATYRIEKKENKVLQVNDVDHAKNETGSKGISHLSGGGISRKSRKKIIKNKINKEGGILAKQSSIACLNNNMDYSIPNNEQISFRADSTNITPTQLQDSSFLPLNLSISITSKTAEPSSSLPEITSQASLDYSVDTASLLGDGSLLGGQFAGDNSVITMGTTTSENKSLLSAFTKSTLHDSSNVGNGQRDEVGVQEDTDDISLSLLESTSSVEYIPTDEELFAVGWAKALDPSSGSYYYFTLDRTNIVWDNPLLDSTSAT